MNSAPTPWGDLLICYFLVVATECERASTRVPPNPIKAALEESQKYGSVSDNVNSAVDTMPIAKITNHMMLYTLILLDSLATDFI